MRTAERSVLVVMAVGLIASVMAGCSPQAAEPAPDTTAPSRSASAKERPAPESVPLTAEQAEAALLTVEDLPTG